MVKENTNKIKVDRELMDKLHIITRQMKHLSELHSLFSEVYLYGVADLLVNGEGGER